MAPRDPLKELEPYRAHFIALPADIDVLKNEILRLRQEFLQKRIEYEAAVAAAPKLRDPTSPAAIDIRDRLQNLAKQRLQILAGEVLFLGKNEYEAFRDNSLHHPGVSVNPSTPYASHSLGERAGFFVLRRIPGHNLPSILSRGRIPKVPKPEQHFWAKHWKKLLVGAASAYAVALGADKLFGDKEPAQNCELTEQDLAGIVTYAQGATPELPAQIRLVDGQIEAACSPGASNLDGLMADAETRLVAGAPAPTAPTPAVPGTPDTSTGIPPANGAHIPESRRFDFGCFDDGGLGPTDAPVPGHGDPAIVTSDMLEAAGVSEDACVPGTFDGPDFSINVVAR